MNIKLISLKITAHNNSTTLKIRMSASKDFLSLIAIFEIPLPTCYLIKNNFVSG